MDRIRCLGCHIVLADIDDKFCGNDCEIEYWIVEAELWKVRAIKYRKLFRKTAILYKAAINFPSHDMPDFVKKEIGVRPNPEYQDLPIGIRLAIGKLGGM